MDERDARAADILEEELRRLGEWEPRKRDIPTLQARMALLAFLGNRNEDDALLQTQYDYWVGRLGLE